MQTKQELKTKVKTDKDHTLGYEINSLARKTWNFFFIPVLNALPVKSRKLIKKSHKSVGEIVDNATSHKALEIIYNKGIKGHTESLYTKISHAVWFSTNNSKAARNRLKLVKRELKGAISSVITKKNSLNILSIASGSARAVIESIEELGFSEDIFIKATFLDKNPKALEYSKEFYSNSSLSSRKNASFEWVEGTVNGFLDSVNSESYDVIEMVGLMDYFNDEKALAIFKKIYSINSKGGFFVTANINDNAEKKFVTKAIGWPMIYRKAEDIGVLVHEAGYEHTDMDMYYEPLEIHSVIVAKK